jgi:alcohol dehydrogenase class IV
MWTAPHGAVCAAVLPHAMEVNVRALRRRAPDSDALRRYGEVARLLTGNPQASAEDAVQWTAEICRRLEIPPLRTYGVRPEDFAVLVEKAAKASSMKANPIVLTPEELTEIIARAA